MKKAVLFDMDGVLYNSMPFHVEAWSEISGKYRLDYTPQDFYLLEGCTGDATIDTLFQRTFGRDATAEEKHKIYGEKAALFNRINPGERMTGAENVLEQVRACGMEALVVTGSGQHSLINQLEKDFPGSFRKEKMVTAFDVRFGKPHPEPYLKGLAKAGCPASEALVVENAPLGIRSAVAAGIFTVAVNTGPLPDAVLREEGPGMLFPGMQDLAKHFDTLPDLPPFRV
ncbi:MAG: HAD-IA family hydrolase [Tannerellaceae bacterium]|jgi:HAD superfamily hydrolase (TIGR01509 family)|nr:HAD-IA family hydrolase [Tannerellaceae bacterium]